MTKIATKITGNFIMEDRGVKLPDGRTIVMVVGMLAMSEDDAADFCAPRPDMKVIMGDAHEGIMRLGIVDNINQPPRFPEESALRDHLAGSRVNELVTSRIWSF